jgi:hypothetical protein
MVVLLREFILVLVLIGELMAVSSLSVDDMLIRSTILFLIYVICLADLGCSLPFLNIFMPDLVPM